MMFNCKKDSIENDTESNYHIKEGIIDNSIENVLGPEPALII